MNRVYKVFPGGKFKVLTLSYDDGKVEDRRLVSILNKYNIKATFNINSGLENQDIRIPKEEWETVYAGHEIAAHTLSHPTMGRMNDYAITREILEDKTELEKIIKKPITGIAYPNGSVDDRVISIAKNLGIKYGRLASDQYAGVKAAEEFSEVAEGPILLGDETGFNMPEDYMRWVPTCHHHHNLMHFAQQFMSLNKKQYLYMMYVWGHSFEFEKNNNWNIIEEFCEAIGNRDDIWYATNGEIVSYYEGLQAATFSADKNIVTNNCGQKLWYQVGNKVVSVEPGETKRLF